MKEKNKFKKYSAEVRDVNFGENVTIIEPVNLYSCTLKDKVFVGPFVEIQKNVVIGERTKIQSHSFICELVEIGADCTISHGVMFINDKFISGGPARGDKQKWLKTIIQDNVHIGTNSTILPVTFAEAIGLTIFLV